MDSGVKLLGIEIGVRWLAIKEDVGRIHELCTDSVLIESFSGSIELTEAVSINASSMIEGGG